MGLDLTNDHTNDSKILYLNDNSTWDDGTLPVFTDIDSAILRLTYITPDLDDYTDEVILNVTSIFTGASTVADLVFPITFNTAPELNAELNPLPDGIWKVSYTVDWAANAGDPVAINIELLLDNIIKNTIYKKLAQVQAKYLCANNHYTKPIDDVLLLKSMHYGMDANAYVAKKEEIINILDLLQRQTK